MNNNVKKILKAIIIFGLYYGFSYAVELIISLFNINISSFKYIYKLIYLYVMELIPFIFVVLIYRKDLIEDFKKFKNNIENYADKYVRYYLLGVVLMSVSNIIISMITSTDTSNNEEIVRRITDILPIYSVISCVIFAPLVEELIYRKTVKNIFVNKKLSIIMSGLLFGLAHVIGTYKGILDLLYVIPYGLFGAVFMYVYIDSDNIWTTISLHLLHNAFFLTTYFISSML